MNHDAAVNPIPVAAPGPVQMDVECRKCGYNLRGLDGLGRCPECGTPVGLSIQGDLLRFADPQWLRTLAKGLNLILWGILANFVAAAGGGVILLMTGNSFLQGAIGLIGSLVSFYGTWFFTEPDPSGLGEAQYVNSRKFVRIALGVGLLGGVLTLVREAVAGYNLGLILAILMGLAVLVGMAGEFARLLYLRRLALRVPDQKIAGRARGLAWAFPITYALVVVGGSIMAFLATRLFAAPGAAPGPATAPAPPAWMSTVMATGGCTIAVLSLVLLILLLMWLRLQYRMRRVLLEQVETAEQIWRAAGA